jgi:RNA polymerase sigma-70 factor, ECF subfamily
MYDTSLIWNKHHKELYAFILGQVKCADQAKDILQDVFLKAHLHASLVKDPQKIRPWLFSVARNAVTDSFRKTKHYPALRSEISDPKTESEESKRFNTENCVRGFIAQLPDGYRQALIRSDLHGESQKALSASLKLSYSALKSRVQRARKMLKESLESCCRIIHDKYGNVIEHIPLNEKCACE